jgi:uncharacterized protein (TIGR03086 family)
MTIQPEVEDIERHLRVCRSFGDEVSAVGARWRSPSPCVGWDARAVLEHVIGFHDVVLLGPLGAKPQRPKGEPEVRWTLTFDALDQLLTSRPGLFYGPIDLPQIRNNPPTQIDGAQLASQLSLDVFIHTWDLAQAVGHTVELDEGLCRLFLNRLPGDKEALKKTGIYAEPIEVVAGADAQTELLSRLGRDPQWQQEQV